MIMHVQNLSVINVAPDLIFIASYYL